MKHTFKKILSLLLCAAMLCGCFALIGNAATVTPVIYVADIENSPVYDKPNTEAAEQVMLPEEATIKEAFLSIAAGFMCISVAGEEDAGTRLVLQGINTLMGDAACNEYGEEEDGYGPHTYEYPLSYFKNDATVVNDVMLALDATDSYVGLEHTYLFTYDWRLSPLENAAKLNNFVKFVKAKEGSSKVSLLCAGNGGVVANAYLYSFASAAGADVASCVFLNAPLLGHNLVSDIMSGNLTHVTDEEDGLLESLLQITKTERANAMVRYINDDPYGLIKQMFDDIFGTEANYSKLGVAIVWIINTALSGQNVWSDLAKTYTDFVTSHQDLIYTQSLKEFLMYSPGLWALVAEDDIDEAFAFLFGENEPSAKLVKKINDFRQVQTSTASTLRTAKAKGINVCLVAGYNMQVIPISGTIDQHTDSMLLTSSASAGATGVKHGSSETLSQAAKDGHEHRSPDYQIDASTGALPENTWYIRNLPYMRYECASAAAFVTWLLNGENQRTIWEEQQYTQYMQYSRENNSIAAIRNGTITYYYGDANIDGFVNAEDARFALRCSVGLNKITSELGLTLADVTFDGQVTAADARKILRFTVGLEPIA